MGWRVTHPLTAQGPKVTRPSHPLLFAPPHSSCTVQPCPTCTSTHSGGSKEEEWGIAEKQSQKHSTHMLQVPAVSNSQLCPWGHSKSFYRETPRPTEGFTNKVTKISKHIPTLSFSHELSGNIYGTIPSYLWIRLYLSTEGTEEGWKSLRSQVTGKTVQQMEPWKRTT